MSVTNIVMLVKDRPRLTRQAIESLIENTDRYSYNLTIIDDFSGYRLYDMVPRLSLLPKVQWTSLRIGEKPKGITGQARNLGVYWAERYWGRGDWLYLSDNDVFFTKGWLEKLDDVMGGAENFGFQVLGGWNHPFLQPKEHPMRFAKPNTGGYVRGQEIPIQWQGTCAEHDAVAGASQLMRWSTWDRYGPLDAHAVGVSQSEDWAFCQKIIKDGGRVGSIYPRVVLNCGLTNSHGQPSPGADLMLAELQEAKKTYPSLYWE